VLPDPLTGFEGVLRKGREGEGQENEERGKEGKGKVASWLGWTSLS